MGHGSVYSLNGTLDEFKFYNRSLSYDEIKNLFYFNSIKLKLSKGINNLFIYGCNLSRNQKYEIVGFTNSGQKIEQEVYIK